MCKVLYLVSLAYRSALPVATTLIAQLKAKSKKTKKNKKKKTTTNKQTLKPIVIPFVFLLMSLQGVMTGMATMSIELFPMENRSFSALVGGISWGVAVCSMALFAYLLRDYSWRYLQYTLSGVSFLTVLLQLWSAEWFLESG